MHQVGASEGIGREEGGVHTFMLMMTSMSSMALAFSNRSMAPNETQRLLVLKILNFLIDLNSSTCI